MNIENLIFNGVNLADEFTDKASTYFIVNDVRGRGVLGVENNLTPVSGMSGAYISQERTPSRVLEVDISLKGESFEGLRKKIERLSDILYTGDDNVPIKFGDEVDRVYYGKLDEVSDIIEMSKIYQSTLIFICSDPYKYGPEQSLSFPSDTSVVENKGTAKADPIFELVAKEKATFAMISNADEEYNLIGEPADDDIEVVDEKVSVLYENGSTIDTWQTASIDMVDDYFIKKITGEMGTDDAGIRAEGYGTHSDGLHGPAVFKEIDPIQDFEIETTFDIISRREIENFRMGILFHDENMNTLGHIGIKDNSRNYKRRVPLARYGPYRGGGRSNGNLIGDSQKNDQARDTTLFYLRAKREGNTFDFYIGEWQNQKHVRSWHEKYHDVNNEYNGKFKFITLYIAKWEDRPNPSRLRMNSVEVFELVTVEEDHTPYIIYPGDKIEFDHKDNDILLNGESRKDLKVFGASFFKLKKGNSSLIVTPENTFDTSIKFRERFR